MATVHLPAGSLKLGKAPPRPRPHAPRFAEFAAAQQVVPPPFVYYFVLDRRWGMFGNDRVGDCTFASTGHQIENWTAWSAGSELDLPDASVLEGYRAVTAAENGGRGYDPSRTDPRTGENPTDTGCVLGDVCDFMVGTGLVDARGDVHKFLATAAVDHARHDLVQSALATFGAAHLGVDLPLSVQDQMDRDPYAAWDVPRGGPVGGGAPGSWGGHAVAAVGFDKNYLYFPSWAGLRRMTWAFFDAYADECHANLSPDWLRAGRTPEGIDLGALARWLGVVGS